MNKKIRSVSALSFYVLAFSLPLFAARPFKANIIQLPLYKIAPGTGVFWIHFNLPRSYKFVHDAPSVIRVNTADASVIKTVVPLEKFSPLDLSVLPHSVMYYANRGKTVLILDMRVNYCSQHVNLCIMEPLRVRIPVEVQVGARGNMDIPVPLCSQSGGCLGKK